MNYLKIKSQSSSEHAGAFNLLIYHQFANDNTRSHGTWKAVCDPGKARRSDGPTCFLPTFQTKMGFTKYLPTSNSLTYLGVKINKYPVRS